jgi:hypothetical protein
LATFADFFDEFSKKYVEEALGRPRVVELQGDLWSLDKAA